MMKKCMVVLGICGSILFLSLSPPPRYERSIGVEQTLAYFRTHAVQFAESAADLQESIRKISANDPLTIGIAKTSLQNCRVQFKKIEFFYNYFFPSITTIYNAPPVIEVEEPFLEYREPTGLQVIAGLLFAPEPAEGKKKLLEQTSLIYEAAHDINSLLYNLPVTDEQILESIQLELINVMTLGIAGFDAPELKTGIAEANQTLTTIEQILVPYLTNKSDQSDSVSYYLNLCIQLTTENNDFDSFNRLAFLTNGALPLQRHINLFIREKGLFLNTTGAVNYLAGDLFSPAAININNRITVDTEMVALGKKLFFEKALSRNNKYSCATCHQPEKYFTDQLPKSIALDGLSTVQRNSPSLLYVAFQYSQFWDGRAKNLEEQIQEVLKNPVEMNADYNKIIAYLNADKYYKKLFNDVFGRRAEDSFVSINNVGASIAAYLESLAPFASPFDKYIDGDKAAMNNNQVNGFNLFMGKALCGTCHTMPLFNGLTPPLYDKSTLEVLGTTNNIEFSKPRLDSDSGRYTTYPIEFYLRAFKTPSLRNVSETPPYMHNGAFPSLKSVLEFYNRGGGNGLGLQVSNQTLLSDSLRLTQGEIDDIISFLGSLSDKPSSFELK